MRQAVRTFLAFLSALCFIGTVAPAQAYLLKGVPFVEAGSLPFSDFVIEVGRFPRAAPPSSGFNGSKLQYNTGGLASYGDFPWLNVLKVAQDYSFSDNRAAPVTPDLLDADGYLKATGTPGIYTRFFMPTQIERPGNYILTCVGNGDTAITGTAIAYDVTGISQIGTIQTVTLTQTPAEMVAGQPIAMSGTSGGTWGGFSTSFRVLDVNQGAKTFRIDTGVTYTGTLVLTSAKATFQDNSAVQNVVGNLNGSIRYATSQTTAIGPNIFQADMNFFIQSIQSTSDYPHDCKFFHASDEALINAGQDFTTNYISKASKFGVVRYLNWQYAEKQNASNVTTWGTRKPTTYISYGATQKRPDLYSGLTTGLSGKTYTAAAPTNNSVTGTAWSGLLDKSTVHVLFVHNPATFGSVTFTSGVANISIPSHNYVVGDKIVFSTASGTMPSNVGAGNYYDVTAIGSGTVQISFFGSPVTPSSSSSGSITASRKWRNYVTTMSSGSATISSSGHDYVNGDQVAFFTFNGSIPSNVTGSQYYFVCSASAGVSYQISTNVGCTGIVTPNANSAATVYSTGALFVNVGGTGNKQLYPAFVNPFIDNQFPEAFNSSSLATLVYDQRLDAWVMLGGNADFGSQGIINMVPYEKMLALGVALGAHPYWVTPIFAADPLTDFMPSLMQYVKDNKPSWMIPRYEPPNELWNTAFPQTGIAAKWATALGSPYNSSFYEWYGRGLSVLGQAAAQVHGGVSNLGVTYHLLGAVQTPVFITGDLNNSLPKFAANAYVSQGSGAVQAPLTGAWGTITFTAVPPSPNSVTGPSATQYVSHFVTAQYFNANVYGVGSGTLDRTTLASAWNGTRFTASSIVSGVMTVASIDDGAALAIGRTVLGQGIPSGTTIASGSAPTWTLSNTGINISYSLGLMAGADTTAPTKWAQSVYDTVINGTITGGNTLTVNSISSGAVIGTNLQIYGGTIPFHGGVTITGMTDPTHFTLTQFGSVPITNQTATFRVGSPVSVDGLALLIPEWSAWAKTNFGITRGAGYEGNYSDDYVGFNNNIVWAAKQESLMQAAATKMFDDYRCIGVAVCPSGFTGEFPSTFLAFGMYPTSNSWSVLEDIYTTPTPPIWNAISAY
jgi:hypothetical protein